MGLKIPPGVAMLFGSTYHKTLEENFRNKIHTKQDFPLSAAKAIFSDEWDHNTSQINWLLEPVDGGFLKDLGIGMISDYLKNTAPKRYPVAVEYEFNINFPDVESDFVGRLDFIGEGNYILEHKTANRRWPQSRADNSIQADGYAAAYLNLFGELPNQIIYDIGVKTTKSPTQTLYTTRTLDRVKEFRERILDCEKLINAEVFPRTGEDNWWCSQAFCGYYPACKHGVPVHQLNVYRNGGI